MKRQLRNDQLLRIAYYEEIFDKVSGVTGQISKLLEELKGLDPEIKELDEYYTGKLWKKDFADDEAGLLPEDLKRGVLSEDGVYNLLEEVKEYLVEEEDEKVTE